MSVEIICVGSELLVGDTVNTNLAWIGKQLNAAGIPVIRDTAIPDEDAIMALTLRRALEVSTLVITIGGLGPTADDRTRDVVAATLGLTLHVDEPLRDALRERYRSRNRQVPDQVFTVQAMVPEGGTILPNAYGTAPGLWVPVGESQAVLLLPGPPRELEAIFTDHAMPRIRALVPPSVARRTLAVHALPESQVEARTVQAIAHLPRLDPAYNIKSGKCHVRLSTSYANRAELDAGEAALRGEFGHLLTSADVDLVAQIAEPLRRRGWKLATAESCTGGGIAAFITDAAGVSDFFAGSIVSYANAVKESQLGVSPGTLAAHGAVSEETAREMVAGLCQRLGVEAGVAVTGIAGPSGGTPEKPVGTVCIATCVNGDIRVLRSHLRGNRAAVRDRSIIVALQQLLDHLLEQAGPAPA